MKGLKFLFVLVLVLVPGVAGCDYTAKTWFHDANRASCIAVCEADAGACVSGCPSLCVIEWYVYPVCLAYCELGCIEVKDYCKGICIQSTWGDFCSHCSPCGDAQCTDSYCETISHYDTSARNQPYAASNWDSCVWDCGADLEQPCTIGATVGGLWCANNKICVPPDTTEDDVFHSPHCCDTADQIWCTWKTEFQTDGECKKKIGAECTTDDECCANFCINGKCSCGLYKQDGETCETFRVPSS